MQEPKRGVWLSFQLATEKVERSRGVSEGKAQKDLLDACASDKLRWRNADDQRPIHLGRLPATTHQSRSWESSR